VHQSLLFSIVLRPRQEVSVPTVFHRSFIFVVIECLTRVHSTSTPVLVLSSPYIDILVTKYANRVQCSINVCIIYYLLCCYICYFYTYVAVPMSPIAYERGVVKDFVAWAH
jgi:hypothetical protein